MANMLRLKVKNIKKYFKYKGHLVHKETGDEHKENDSEGPALEDSCDEGPASDVVDEDKHHGWDHP